MELWLGDNLGVMGFFAVWVGIMLFSAAYVAFGYVMTRLLVGKPQFKKSVMLMIIPLTFFITLVVVKGAPVINKAIRSRIEAQKAPAQDQVPFDARNSSFGVEGARVTLVNGVAETQFASMPDVKVVTRYFGNRVSHDLDNDGREDAVFLVTQDKGGSGTFFYVVAVLNTANGYVGSNSYLLGDRIAPQSMNIDEGQTAQGTMRDNVIVVNYAVRKPSEPMTTAPSVGKSVWLKLDPRAMKFGEVAQNFEGESR